MSVTEQRYTAVLAVIADGRTVSELASFLLRRKEGPTEPYLDTGTDTFTQTLPDSR